MKAVIITLLVAVALLGLTHAAVDCNQVNSYLASCVPYLTSGGNPLPACCAGVKKLQGMATTTPDKRAACECVKTAANKYPQIKEDAATSLPTKCGVTLDIPISKSTNCQAIN